MYSITEFPSESLTWARFLSLARSKLRLCSANHRAGYFSNLACDWLSIVWAYSEQETENGPWFMMVTGTLFRQPYLSDARSPMTYSWFFSSCSYRVFMYRSREHGGEVEWRQCTGFMCVKVRTKRDHALVLWDSPVSFPWYRQKRRHHMKPIQHQNAEIWCFMYC